LGLNDSVLSGIQEDRAAELDVVALTSVVLNAWLWKNPAPQHFHSMHSTPFHMPNLNTGVSTPINVPARIVEVNGVKKLIVDIPALFSNSRRGSDSASGDQPKAKWPSGRFKTIQDVVKLFEVRGLEEVTNLDHPGVQKKCNVRLMYDEWLSLGSEQEKWDD
jgi:hypothetical protein